jgi:hypothetical protein
LTRSRHGPGSATAGSRRTPHPACSAAAASHTRRIRPHSKRPGRPGPRGGRRTGRSRAGLDPMHLRLAARGRQRRGHDRQLVLIDRNPHTHPIGAVKLTSGMGWASQQVACGAEAALNTGKVNPRNPRRARTSPPRRPCWLAASQHEHVLIVGVLPNGEELDRPLGK